MHTSLWAKYRILEPPNGLGGGESVCFAKRPIPARVWGLREEGLTQGGRHLQEWKHVLILLMVCRNHYVILDVYSIQMTRVPLCERQGRT